MLLIIGWSCENVATWRKLKGGHSLQKRGGETEKQITNITGDFSAQMLLKLNKMVQHRACWYCCLIRQPEVAANGRM